MDLANVIRELRAELEYLDQAILALESMNSSIPKKRGRPRKSAIQNGAVIGIAPVSQAALRLSKASSSNGSDEN